MDDKTRLAAGIAKHLRSRRHALPELLRKRGERGFVYVERPQTIRRECHGHRHENVLV